MKILNLSFPFSGLTLLFSLFIFNHSTANYIKTNIAFEIESMDVCEDGTFIWQTKGEAGCVNYTVEQYVLNRWIAAYNIEGKGNMNHNLYMVKLSLNSGNTKIRLKYKINNSKNYFSQPTTFFSKKSEVTVGLFKNKKVNFSDETFYVLYNPYGALIQQGQAKDIDISKLPYGNYVLLYDNRVTEFEKKKLSLFKKSTIKKKRKPIRNPYSRYKIS